MVWVKLDDQFPDHPKVVAAGPCAAWLHVCAIAYCNRHLTDGFIPRGKAHSLADYTHISLALGGNDMVQVADDVTCSWMAGRLCEVGLWEEIDGGYLIHDYLEFQPSRVEVEELREARSEAGRKGGQASAKARAKQKVKQELEHSLEQTPSKGSSKIQANFNPVPVPVPEPPVVSSNSRRLNPGEADANEWGRTRVQRLALACGLTGYALVDAEPKLERALKGSSEADVVAAIEAASSPKTRDRLGMALSVLKKRKTTAA